METQDLKTQKQGAHVADSFTYSFESPQSAHEIFEFVRNVRNWWVGIFDETITGNSQNLGDEFEFLAGDGVHKTKQKLVLLQQDEKVMWEVLECRLSFLSKMDEWIGTHFGFEIADLGEKTKVTFIHDGLVPKFECYGNCSGAWTQYLDALKSKLS